MATFAYSLCCWGPWLGSDGLVWLQNKVEPAMDEVADDGAAELGDTEKAAAQT